MKITKELVKYFDQEQKEFGTKVALHNLMWKFASQLLKDLGAKSIKTSYKK